MGKCILCNSGATINTQDNASRTIYNCQNCGVFVLSDLVVAQAKRHHCELAAYFTSRKLAGYNEIVLVSFDKAKKDKDYLQLTVEQILDLFPQTFSQQMDLVLQNLTRMSSFEGAEIKVENLDLFPVFYIRQVSYDALSFVIKSMQKLDLLEVNYYSSSFFPCGVIVSPSGWDRVSKMREGQINQDSALLLYPGKDSEQKEIFNRVAAKASRECGYHVVGSNTVSSADQVNHEMVGRIKSSAYLIADLTNNHGAAYFAAGMAHALGKTSILTCHKSALRKLELDTEQFSVLTWQDEDGLYLQILNAIRALVL